MSPATDDSDRALILDGVVKRYLTSHQFNGAGPGSRDSETVAAVRSLITAGELTIEFGDRHPNRHIKSFPAETIETQLEKFDRLGLEQGGLYPSPQALAVRVDRGSYPGKPYTLELALGAGQLEKRFFDLGILERYRTDPRFHYRCNDVGGWFSVTSEAAEKGHAAERDQTSMQDFGFAYNEKLQRAVVAFVRYLSGLSPEHQQMWKTFELAPEGWSAHPAWWAAAMGHWPERISMFDAFILELQTTNNLCRAIGWPVLFVRDFLEDSRPHDFAFMLRSTKKAFEGFVHLLDKVMSENLSKEFFRSSGIALEEEKARPDGKIAVRPRGTIAMLEEWLMTRFSTSDRKPLEDTLAVFREVRKLRQPPAHAIGPDEFDPSYFEQQRELMMRAYGSVRVLRLVFSIHPDALTVEIPRWIKEGLIYWL